ncbi:unnamed protein product, partial [Pylaiella littoralis]
MGCMQSKHTGLILSEDDIKECEVTEAESVRESAQAVKAMQDARVLNPASCQGDMTWDLMHARRSVFITPPDFVRDLCLFIVSRTNLIAIRAGKDGCCPGTIFAPQAGHIYLLKNIKCPQTQTLEIEMAELPSENNTMLPQLATKMALQRPDMASTVTAIRVSLAHAYYGTPPYAIPFSMALPKALNTPLPPMDEAVHQASHSFAGGLRSVFLASWSLDPRAITDQAAAAGLATANRVKNFQFTRGQPRYGAIDVGHVAGVAESEPGQDESAGHACILALVRALQYNTFFTHLDLSTVNVSAGRCWSEDPLRSSTVATGPLATAAQGLLGWNVTLQSFLAPKLPRGPDGSSLLNWAAIGSALLVNPRPMIATWDLTDCGIGDAGLTSLLPAWWRIFSHIAPVRELRLSGNGLGQTSLAPFFNMLNGTGFTFQTPQGLPLPPGSLPAPNTSFLTCLELGGCDLRGAFPSLAMLLSRCPFLRKLDVSNPPRAQGHVLGLQEAAGVFGALVNSLCPLEELDMRGHWSVEAGAHTTIESSSCLAGLIARKPTLSQLSLGEVAYDTTKTAETDVPVVAAAVLMCGADVAADRKNQTVDLSNCRLLSWPPVGPAAPAALILRSCGVSLAWYQGKYFCCEFDRRTGLSRENVLCRFDQGVNLFFFMLDPDTKNSLVVGLGQLVASSPLEALIMPGDWSSNGINCIPGFLMTTFFPALGKSKTLLELDVTGHGFGDEGCIAMGAALRQNRSIATLSYDHNSVTLEGFKAIRGCLYGNKKLVNVSAPVSDLATRIAYLGNEVMLGQNRMWEIKGRIKAAYKYNKPEFHRQIAIISANNKAWKALDREKNRTIEVTSVIAACIESNRQLRDTKVADKSAAKMERQKEAVEERYATKMSKILTKLSKETDKARVQAASTKTSPFKARPRQFFYTEKARKRRQRQRQRQQQPNHNHSSDSIDTDGGGSGLYFFMLPSMSSTPYYHDNGGCSDDRERGGGGGGGALDQGVQPGGGQGSASVSPEGEELVDVHDDYVTVPETGDGGEWSNPLDGVRDLITKGGPSVFDPSNLGRIDDLLREAGSDVYERMGPLIGEAGDFGSKVAETASSWGTDLGGIFGDIGESAGDAFGGLGGLFSDIGDAFGDGFSGIGDALGGVGDGIGDVLGGAINLAEDGLDAAGDVMGDAVDAVGDVMNAAGDVAEDAVDAAGDLAADIGDGIGDGLDAAGDLTEGVVDAVGGAFDAGEELAGDGLDAARDLGGDAVDAVGDAVEDAVGGDDDKGGADDVDMYAGAGPMDLDDEGPTGGGSFAKVLSGPRRLVEAFSVHRTRGQQQGIDADRCLMGTEEWTAPRLRAREERRRGQVLASWEEQMFEMAKEVDRPHAFPYKTKLHAFQAGRTLPSQKSRVTLVTQCSADRLHAVRLQALRWGGDISLAVYVPSAPSFATAKTLLEIQRLCDAIDQAVRTADSSSSSDAASSQNNQYQQLSLDVAILEGAESDPARHDHCGPLYPVNNLRNLALLQARDDNYHPAQAVFLIDSDCLPSDNLLDELHSQEVQDRINNAEGGSARTRGSRTGEASAPSHPAAIVVPCLEFVKGTAAAAAAASGKDPTVPLSTREIIKMLREGNAQGFHVDYFFKGHGPTDFHRWAASATDESAGALAYSVPFESCFEPYVVVDKAATPMYDERFRGYGMNKESRVAHLLSLASGSPGTDATKPAVKSAEFIVLRKGCVFALPHARSPGWDETYGPHGDPLRRYQIKALWSKFQGETIDGLLPVVCSSTAAIAASVHSARSDSRFLPPPFLPSYRLCQSLPASREGSEDIKSDFAPMSSDAFSTIGAEQTRCERRKRLE